MSKLWLCEKPAQAKLVAARIGTTGRGDGYIDTKDGKVTWCIGHLLGLKSPDQHDSKWKKWSLESLPIVPENFELEISKGKEKQAKIVGKLLKESNHVVIATDGDREGELLGREMLDYFKWSGNIDRMWNTSLDDKSLDKALAAIKPGIDTEPLYFAAQARSEADYIAGMTLTRAATVCFSNGDEVFSVGRVQTAVLGMIVRRDLEIKNFKPSSYYDLKAVFEKDGQQYHLIHAPKEEKRITEQSKAEEIINSISGKTEKLEVEKIRKKSAPPKLFSLSSLQQAANKKYGWSSSDTKALAQEIYEMAIISYPRVDCEFLPNEQEEDAAHIIEGLTHFSEFDSFTSLIGDDYEKLVYRKTAFNTSKTTAHHAIIPTVKMPPLDNLSDKQTQLYTLIAERYLLIFLDDYVYDSTSIKTTVEDRLFSASGSVPVSLGWKAVFNDDKKEDDNQKFPELENGEAITFSDIEILSKQTKCRPSYTQASILKDMENISKFTDDKEVLAIIKARIKEDSNAGIGTPATRDTFVDILLNRSYITINKNKLFATDSGFKLIEALPSAITDPIETCVMEEKLDEISAGDLDKSEFMRYAVAHTVNVLDHIKEQAKSFSKNAAEHACPECGSGLVRRKGSNGFFWPCSGYPDCKFTTSDAGGKPAPKKATETSGECPDCGKPLVKREGVAKASKKKYKFWGCTGFPDCKSSFQDKKGKPEIKAA